MRGRPKNATDPTPEHIEKRIQELRRRAEAGEPFWPMPDLEEANEAVNEPVPDTLQGERYLNGTGATTAPLD